MRPRKKRGGGCLWVFVALLLIAAGAGAAAYFHLQTLVARSVEAVATRVAGEPVSVSSVRLLPWSGEGTLRDVAVRAPDGYRAEHSLRAPRVDFEVDVRSLLEDEGPVVVRRVEVVGAVVEQEAGPRGTCVGEVLDHVESVADSEAEAPTDGGRRVDVGRFALLGTTTSAGEGGRGAAVGDVVVEGPGGGEGVTVFELARRVARGLREALDETGAAAGQPEPDQEPREPTASERILEEGARRAGAEARQALGGAYAD